MGFVYINGVFDLFGLLPLLAPYSYYVHKSKIVLQGCRKQLSRIMVSDGPFGGFRADYGPSKLFHAHPEGLRVLIFYDESSGARLRPIFGPFWDRPWLNYF